ncbi:aromatic ring-hydroxylating oxygenase subunit alpha [Sphingomonas jatrophae]|uniref:Rieske [2Fe-2S] domain-containing protein n=1 Tax=Sphingomonas jatrophae TaxID=1166337 RepID=A0A1I6M1T1_9SPHN|nr:aromatic ring-hydroxylating dioxygenase subunit alpha [Sphingomonas jatrophae]SFS09623.1 Rieske [2Fe-2S] domain-containing protein [Sphingomonas jatrophae]
MAERDPTIAAAGAARSPGATWTDILEVDGRPVPAFLKEESYRYLGSEPIDATVYTSAEHQALENARMWPNVWQFAARDEDMPEPGDYIVYENAGRSFLVVRQDDGSVRAMHNVCLHRGRKLRLEDGSADRFQCPFHGFTWNKDGSLADIPCRWDFTHLTDAKMQLPEAEVARWQGYIFLRENHGGPSIEEFLAPLPEFFERWRHDQCTTAIWVGKEVAANWKVTMEAFMEAWHTIVTHPQLLPFTGDANTSYNIYGDNVNVAYTPFGVMSPHIDPEGKEQQWIVDEFIKYNGRSADNYADSPYAVTVPEGMSARRALGEAMRKNFAETFGHADLHEQATDVEVLDGLVYNVFPNFAPWGGYMPNIVYRWRPGSDPDHCLMEVRILVRIPEDQPIPRGVPMKLLGRDQKWTDAPELGVLGHVFEQDMENLPYVQDGLKVSKTGEVQLGDYQEIRIRQFHQTMRKYLDA